jgi:hypothetical protein
MLTSVLRSPRLNGMGNGIWDRVYISDFINEQKKNKKKARAKISGTVTDYLFVPKDDSKQTRRYRN